jgi:hypothetical protein
LAWYGGIEENKRKWWDPLLEGVGGPPIMECGKGNLKEYAK